MAVKDQFNDDQIRSEVRKHYGELAAAGGCCGPDAQGTDSSCCAPHVDTTSLIYEDPGVGTLPEEVRSLSAGCGDPVTLAELKSGQTVLDLGSGGGIDCFLAAQKVGPTGRVIGVDMTPEMLSRARANKARLDAQNVEFRLGEIEHLPVPDDSVDVIISNCVINLSPDKPQVFREAYRVLRSGGKFAVSDIVADGPLPEQMQGDAASWAGCVAGAIDQHEFEQALKDVGFIDVELTPQVLDQDQVVRLMEDEGSIPFEAGSVSERKPKIQINGQWIELELGDRKLPFSARITARKP